MLTTRGWSFLVVVLSVLTLGVMNSRNSVIVIALTFLLWFLGEWFLFVLRIRLALPSLRTRRELRDDRGAVDTLWAGRTFTVMAELRLPHWLELPFVRIADFIPFGVQAQGSSSRDGLVSLEAPLGLIYQIRCPAAGKIRFEGIAIQLADFQGFFYHAGFIPGSVVYRVLPPLADAEGQRPTVKRHNLLPSPGMHRHLRAGSGSELLDLRDYLPGDPPKTIAWKVSARRDRLITKAFESEVPLRCTLFVDTSHSVRIGSWGQNALGRQVEIAAAVAQAAAGARDLIGLCLFDEKQVSHYVRPARGTRHIISLFNVLADAAGLAPATGAVRLKALLPLGYAFAQEVYPYLMRQEVNRVPAWFPFLAQPMHPRAGVGKFLFRALFTGVALLPMASFGFLAYLAADLLAPLAQIFIMVPEGWLALLGGALVVSVAILYYAVLNVAYRFLSLVWSSQRRRLSRWRKPLAALLSERYGLLPGGVGLFLEDDVQFGLYLQRFLADHHVPYPLPLYDRKGRYLFASPGKIDVLAKALMRAVGKGRDNELFVLQVDLLELVDELEPLLRAVKVTLSRHHKVMVICPWPPGVPTPDGARSQGIHAGIAPHADLHSTVYQATLSRLHQAFGRLRQSFARLGVPVVCAESGDPVQLILDRLDRLRALGLGRRR
jgi:uncharacterized protein (DUF58 family)